jgi:transposase
LYVFRGRNASLLKILLWDGTGLCLFTKRMDHGGFLSPRMAEPGDTVTLTPAHLAMLIAGIDCRAPERSGGRFWPSDHKLKNRLSAGKLLGQSRILT